MPRTHGVRLRASRLPIIFRLSVASRRYWTGSGLHLSRSQIKSGRIDGAARRELGGKECARLVRRRARSAHPSPKTNASVPRLIFHVRQQHVTEVSLAEHNNVVKAFPSDRTD
jgi:hypothetical protein